MSNAHTPEPWNYDTDSMEIYSLETAEEVDEGHAANARRIVAAVNACAGIDTVQLEMLDVVAALDSLNKVRAQRDELLAAAKNLHNVMGRYHTEQAFKRLMAVVETITKDHT
jgi:hypothetical protein